MVILITGATHSGKTMLAQRMLERYGYPYLSIDHLKMGLIRSGQTDLSVEDDDALTAYLWPIVREIVKTAIENQQNLIVEGCYLLCDKRVGKSFGGDALHIFGSFIGIHFLYPPILFIFDTNIIQPKKEKFNRFFNKLFFCGIK